MKFSSSLLKRTKKWILISSIPIASFFSVGFIDSYFELSCGGNKRWLEVFVKQRPGTIRKLRRKEKECPRITRTQKDRTIIHRLIENHRSGKRRT